MMAKVDSMQQLGKLYAPSRKEFAVVEVPTLNFLMIDGHGDPNQAPAYKEAVEALYSLAYTLKFAVKRQQGTDYRVMPLEGLWWVEDMRQFSVEDKSAWDWTMMIMQPEPVNEVLFAQALAEVTRKKGSLPSLGQVRLAPYDEGLCVQIMHIGPYAAEGPTLERMHHSFIPENGFVRTGKHHEIYLSDPNRTAPEKLKTILRQPVQKAG